MYRIFIVEDDPVIAAAVANALSRWGFQVRAAGDFQNPLALFDAWQPHLVLLDVSLPYFNGYYWCGEIRKRGKTPVIFLSSRSEAMDIVTAVSMGADDYLAKPVDMSVLAAKIQALLRRSYDYDAAGTPAPGGGGAANALKIGGALLDTPASCLRKDGVRVPLTKNELGILQMLMERKGMVVAREELMLRLWDSDEFVDENTLTVNINRLRRALESAGLGGRINTHKGQGYSIHD